MPAVLDTHAAVWYLLESKRLPEAIYLLIDRAAAGGEPTYISAISLVEVVYLVERQRIAADAFEWFASQLASRSPAFNVVPLNAEIANALRGIPREYVPDMPDRIIAATATLASHSSRATVGSNPLASKRFGSRRDSDL